MIDVDQRHRHDGPSQPCSSAWPTWKAPPRLCSSPFKPRLLMIPEVVNGRLSRSTLTFLDRSHSSQKLIAAPETRVVSLVGSGFISSFIYVCDNAPQNTRDASPSYSLGWTAPRSKRFGWGDSRMINLHGSRWAPGTSRTREVQTAALPPEQRHAVTRHEEFERFSKLLFRLEWKANHLLISQQQVLIHHDPQIATGWVFTSNPTEAETMFKVDFFEFYILLERAIIHLLAVFLIVVSASTTFEADNDGLSAADGSQIFGDGHVFNRATHSYHENVLKALDQSKNPFHEILGSGQVREYLSIAKEFRNRWKDAEEQAASSSSPDRNNGRQRRYERLLRELKLEEMLSCLLLALKAAKGLAEEECLRVGRSNPTIEQRAQSDHTQQPWESMPDAMEWD